MTNVPTPELEPGMTLLRTPSERSPALHQLVMDAATAPGEVLWIDAGANAKTTVLYEVAPHRRLLDDIKIARAFTAYQHHTLVRELLERVTARTSLVVAPCAASLYRDDDLDEAEADALCAGSMALLGDLGRAASVPVLCTDAVTDGFTALVEEEADVTITADRTTVGQAFRVDGEAPHAYWTADGSQWQTTIPYWVELFGETADAMATVPTTDVGIAEVG